MSSNNQFGGIILPTADEIQVFGQPEAEMVKLVVLGVSRPSGSSPHLSECYLAEMAERSGVSMDELINILNEGGYPDFLSS